MSAWIYLYIGILISFIANPLMKMSDGFANVWMGVGALILFAIATTFYGFAIKTIPIAVAYVIWSGLGVAVFALIGMLWFNEPLTVIRLLFIAMVLGGAIGLQLTGGK